MIIRDAIRGIRRALGMTQQQFADELSVKRSLIGAYEEGRAEPRLELLSKIAELGGISLDSLFSKKVSDLDVERGSQLMNRIPLVPTKAAGWLLKRIRRY